MNVEKLPRWSYWAIGTLVLWTIWGLMVGRPMMQRVAELRDLDRKTDTEHTALDQRMTAVPELVLRLNEARHTLDSTLGRYSTDDGIDDLVHQLRVSGERRDLSEVRADPELTSLLRGPTVASASGPGNGRLDTVIVNLTASGGFKSLGQWLDDVENRPDFRFWMLCHWASGSDNGIVDLEAQAALVVVNQPDTLTTLITMGPAE